MRRTSLPSEAIALGAAGIVFSLVALFQLFAGGFNSYNLGGVTFYVVIAAVFFWFAQKALAKRGAK